MLMTADRIIDLANKNRSTTINTLLKTPHLLSLINTLSQKNIHLEIHTNASTKLISTLFNLLKINMFTTYCDVNDSGWQDDEKMKELTLENAQYITLHQNDTLCAFLYLQYVVEETKDDDIMCSAVYCYELQLSESFRKFGLGKVLMDVMERLGKASGLEKAMLTCFKCNTAALTFYTKLGYKIDDISPSMYDGRRAQRQTYEIMGKVLK